MTMSIGILETGLPPASLINRHGRYDAMVRRMLGPSGFHCATYAVQAGELPGQAEAHDGYVVTGSSAGVYDPLPWIAPLKTFLREAHGRVPLVGLCFGHQVLTEALGGRVEKSAKGWGLGLHRYAVAPDAAWGASGMAGIAVAASHQDQVVEAPPGATVLAASAFTPHAALAYAGGPSLSMQFHPEFDRDYAEALIHLRRATLGEEEATRLLATLDGRSDAPQVAAWIRDHLRGARHVRGEATTD